MIVRCATVLDADAIAAVQYRTWLDAYEDYIDPDRLHALRPGRADRWREHLGGPMRAWVALTDDAIAGFSAAGPSRDEDAGDLTGELYSIYVAPERQGFGTGRLVLEPAAEHLRDDGYRTATLWVFEQNVRARAFYEHLGWVLDSEEARDDLWAPEVRYRRSL